MLIKSRNQNIFPIFKFAVKFYFQQYIVCRGKIYRSKIIGGRGGATSAFYSVKLCNTFTIHDAFSISMVLSVVFWNDTLLIL